MYDNLPNRYKRLSEILMSVPTIGKEGWWEGGTEKKKERGI